MMVKTHPAGPTQTYLGSLPSGAAGVRHTLYLMRALVQRGKTNWLVRQRAQSLVQGLPQQDYAAEVRALHAFVRDHIRYVRDVRGVETLHSADKVLELRGGDCDDKAILLASMLESIGHATRFKAVGFAPGKYSHVFVEVQLNGKWVPLETTRPWDAGKAPAGVRSVMIVKND